MMSRNHQRTIAWLVLMGVGVGVVRIVLRPGEVPVAGERPSGARVSLPAFRLDPNTASQAELEAIPGMGVARAKALLADRESQRAAGIDRPYRTLSDLDRIRGFGEVSLQKLGGFLEFGGDQTREGVP